jgi:3-oxoacyl-[acyl-carrier-protein] synthase-3
MGVFVIEDVELAGISACVPSKIESNYKNDIFHSEDDAIRFIETTGVKERRIADSGTCTSDLTSLACKELLKKLNWDKSEIRVLLCVTQTPDFHGPMNSSLIQNTLGFSKECIAFDIPIGCSGFIYGAAVISSLLKCLGDSKGMLLVGDTLSKQASPKDKSTQPLFGDAGCAIAFKTSTNSCNKFVFDLGGDGSGFKSLYLRDGGYRFPFNISSLEFAESPDGLIRNGCHTVMEGMDVFSFGISTAPKTVRSILDYCKLNVSQIDYFIFHQANHFMNEMIRKKLKIKSEQVPYSLGKFGNTSSATIPLTMISELKGELQEKSLKLIFCGFGIGLSWGTMYVETSNLVCADLLEI